MTSPNNRLFVGSIPYRYTEGQLLSLFVPFGRIVSVSIIKSRWGKSRGMGYVEYDSVESAIQAKQALHNYLLEDRTIIVDFAKPDPFNTPEGQARHEEALKHRRRNPQNHSLPQSRERQGFGSHEDSGNRSHFKSFSRHAPKSNRQSVYDQRTHLSRVGSKFSNRNKKK